MFNVITFFHYNVHRLWIHNQTWQYSAPSCLVNVSKPAVGWWLWWWWYTPRSNITPDGEPFRFVKHIRSIIVIPLICVIMCTWNWCHFYIDGTPVNKTYELKRGLHVMLFWYFLWTTLYTCHILLDISLLVLKELNEAAVISIGKIFTTRDLYYCFWWYE